MPTVVAVDVGGTFDDDRVLPKLAGKRNRAEAREKLRGEFRVQRAGAAQAPRDARMNPARIYVLQVEREIRDAARERHRACGIQRARGRAVDERAEHDALEVSSPRAPRPLPLAFAVRPSTSIVPEKS